MMKRLLFTLSILFFVLSNPVFSQAAEKVQKVTPGYKSVYDNTDPVCNCEDLLKVEIPDTKIESARFVQSNNTCLVRAIVNHPPFDDRVTITIALPMKNWNGRFLGFGGAGFVGGLPFSVYGHSSSDGFVTGYTDGGHQGGSAAFAYNEKEDRLDWQNIRDFSHVAVHDMTATGKALVQALYGKLAGYSYFIGISNGGRQAMEEVQRYPEDYDGLIANCPAIYWNHFLIGYLWPQAVMNDLNNFLPREKLIAVTDAVIASCDGDDGLVDSVIDDPFNCKWDPKEFVGTKVGGLVFTEADANVVRKIWEGPRGHDGRFLWDGLTRGSYLCDYAITKGDPVVGVPDKGVVEWVKYFLLQDPLWDGKSITCSEFEMLFIQAVDQYASLYETSNTALSPFRDHGGKLIMTHGLADNMIPPQGSIKYYKLLQEKMGGIKATSKFARLFLFPGVDHVFKGPGVKPVDPFGALMKWVEEGKAPEYLDAELKDEAGEVIRRKAIYPYGKNNK